MNEVIQLEVHYIKQRIAALEEESRERGLLIGILIERIGELQDELEMRGHGSNTDK